MNHALEIELRDQGKNMETIARVRQNVRLDLKYDTDFKLAKGEHFRLACLAMAALGQPDEINPHKNSKGERVVVGPYVSDAVRYVLHGMDVTRTDRDLVAHYACLINVSARF